jgi:hypothetical protein
VVVLLNNAYEITLGVKDRKSDVGIPRPVWFVHESDIPYLLRFRALTPTGTKNMLAYPTLKISMNGVGIDAEVKSIADRNGVDEVERRFRSKYG